MQHKADRRFAAFSAAAAVAGLPPPTRMPSRHHGAHYARCACERQWVFVYIQTAQGFEAGPQNRSGVEACPRRRAKAERSTMKAG